MYTKSAHKHHNYSPCIEFFTLLLILVSPSGPQTLNSFFYLFPSFPFEPNNTLQMGYIN